MTKAFFITGIGTGVGKTIVTCSLIRQLQERGEKVFSIKPLISGWEDDSAQNDTMQILRSLALPALPENIDKISPWRFNAPLAPSMAARIENAEINYDAVLNFCKQAQTCDGYLLCEGSGGVMVPLNQDKTTLDLMSDLGFGVILVAGTYLGAISHTLTALNAIEAVGCRLYGIILNESAEGIALKDVAVELANFTSIPIYPLKRVLGQGEIWEGTENILGVLK